MSLIINNILDPNDVGTVSPGNLGLFAGTGDLFYVKKSDGTYYPITSTVSGYNSSLIFNTFSYVLSITDGNSTQTASLIDLASGYYNAFLSVSTASNVLTLIDGYSTLTASLDYYAGGFNTGISYNTASNVLSITDGNGTISATLSSTGANTSFTFNPFDNVLSIVDGFGTKTASVSLLSGNTTMSYNNEILSLQDGRGTLTASIPHFSLVDSIDTSPSYLFDKFVDGNISPVKVDSGSYSPTNPKIKFIQKSITFTSRYTGSTTSIPVVDTGVSTVNRGFPILGLFNGTTYDGWSVVSDDFGGGIDTPTLEDRYFGDPLPINREGVTWAGATSGTGSNCVFVLTDGTYRVSISGSINLGPGFTASGIVAYRFQYLSSNTSVLPGCITPLCREATSTSSNSIEGGVYFSNQTILVVDTTLTGCGGAGGGGRFLLRVLNMTGTTLNPSAFDAVNITFEKIS